MTAELFRTLVSSVFNLDCDSSSDFTLLDYILRLLVDFERSDLSKGDDFSLLCFRISLDDTQRSSCSERTINNIATENDS